MSGDAVKAAEKQPVPMWANVVTGLLVVARPLLAIRDANTRVQAVQMQPLWA